MTPVTSRHVTEAEAEAEAEKNVLSLEKKEPKKYISKAQSPAVVIEYCRERGLPETDGQWFYDKCEGCGWTNNGKAIKDWRATVRQWAAQRDIFPSHKRGIAPSSFRRVTPDPNQERVDQEYEEHMRRMARKRAST